MRPRSCWWRIAVGWIWLLVVLELAVHTPLQQHWPLNLLNVLQPWWAIPLLPGLLVVWHTPRWRWTTLVLLAAWGIGYSPRWFPPTTGGAPSLRILTWNVWGRNTDAANLISIIEHEQPDIIALQEVDEQLRQPLVAALSATYPFYEVRLPTEPGLQPSDLALFSRYPYISAPIDCPYWRCYRRAVTMQLGNQALTFINVHIERSPQATLSISGLTIPLSLSTIREDTVIAELLRATQPEQSVIIVGDFNTTERQAGYTRLTTQFHDSWRESGVGMGFTWPDRWFLPELVRIDYVWHSAAWQSISAHTGSGASDHRYLMVALSQR